MVLLRQCFAEGEAASFSKTRKILERRLYDAGERDLLAGIKEWQRAHAKLLNKALDELVQERMAAEGLMPGPSPGPDGRMHDGIVRGPASPRELLRTFWYGGQIHWGEQRKARSLLEANPFDAAWADLYARQAAVDLAQFYIGFAVLVEQALGGQSKDELRGWDSNPQPTG
jgi:hypothetical protein